MLGVSLPSITPHLQIVKVLDRIFDPFFSARFMGRGLGLPVSLGIIRAHHGGLQIETQVGHGTTFKIVLPLAPALQPATWTTPISAFVQRPAIQPLSGERAVLVIDDEVGVREAVRDVLEVSGLKVLMAESGEAGLAVYQARQSDIGLILLDLSMPGLSGEETLQRLLAINPVAPVLLSSGYDEQETLSHVAPPEIVGFLKKPYTAMTLREIVGRHLV